jgi:hypothetical protein
LSITNTFEGSVFTPPSEKNVTDFIRQEFPFLRVQQVDKAASYYMALDTTLPGSLDQSIAVLGECAYDSLCPNKINNFHTFSAIFICPTYFLLNAFNGKSWKVTIFLRMCANNFDLTIGRVRYSSR